MLKVDITLIITASFHSGYNFLKIRCPEDKENGICGFIIIIFF